MGIYGFSLAEIKDSLKILFPLDRKKGSWFVLARKSVSITRIEVFFEKSVSTIRKKCFFLQKTASCVPLVVIKILY